jgi:hypothetical protein
MYVGLCDCYNGAPSQANRGEFGDDERKGQKDINLKNDVDVKIRAEVYKGYLMYTMSGEVYKGYLMYTMSGEPEDDICLCRFLPPADLGWFNLYNAFPMPMYAKS